MEKTYTTPMLKQYQELKSQHPDCLLFFRLGDFYELFLEDAHIGARVLDITLTSRPGGRDGRIPMAGVPYHAVDSYLSKLVKAGYKVAICEQVSEPNKYGLVDREIVRIVTPGTVLDEKALERKENNYLVSIALDSTCFAIAAADVSTGTFQVSEFPTHSIEVTLKNELSRINPSECILSEKNYNSPEILKAINIDSKINVYPFIKWDTYARKAKQSLQKHFGVVTLASFDLDKSPVSVEAAAVLLGYLKETQKHALSHITTLSRTQTSDYVVLDRSTITNLELLSTVRDGDTKDSLLSSIDFTKTAMGGRMIKHWLLNPLTKKEDIEGRLSSVEEFSKLRAVRNDIRTILSDIADIERIVSRLAVGIGNPRDLINLKESLLRIMQVKNCLSETKTPLIRKLYKNVSPKIGKIAAFINKTIEPDPPVDIKQGGFIKPGIHTELDMLRKSIGGSSEFLKTLELQERSRSGITSLKVRSNKVFGFYIEVSKSNVNSVPKNYIRKQTLVNAERFITEDLKSHEEIVMRAQEKTKDLEETLFNRTVETILSDLSILQKAAKSIASVDCLSNFSYLAEKQDYTKPKLLYSGEIRLKESRHPVVEQVLEDKQFVPNDIVLNDINQSLLLITGPNMAGKSVLIRQVAVIVLLTHIGSFVPAKSAHISLVDRIFVRSGANDAISKGLSTFMVEMVETAHILREMTPKSLIIMDEIGRGTSTYDGISIAWAVAEYLVTHSKKCPKTLFATHYHELQSLADAFPKRIRNFHMAVIEENDQPVFLYTLLPGAAPHSFGIAVAKLAGVPKEVINNSRAMLATLEKRTSKNKPLSKVQKKKDLNGLHSQLKEIDISNMTPLEALNTLSLLKEEVLKK